MSIMNPYLREIEEFNRAEITIFSQGVFLAGFIPGSHSGHPGLFTIDNLVTGPHHRSSPPAWQLGNPDGGRPGAGDGKAGECKIRLRKRKSILLVKKTSQI
jgi:hypothetical protein